MRENRMDNLISKQEAIKAVSELPTYYADSGGYYGGAHEPLEALLEPMDVINTIKALPTIERIVITDALTVCVKQQWIPCTEKLPEPRIDVLCSTTDMGGCVIGYYEEHCNIWFAHIWWHDDIEMIVNAWMPLPPCYKGE